MDVREGIRTQPMRSLQITVVAICIVLAMIDGYEVVSMPFAMPFLGKAWGLSPVEVGYLLSASVFGMALGATFVSPIADVIGRRRHILLCLMMIAIGMASSAAAQSVPQLVGLRAFAGLFIGAVISSINIMVAEYSSEKRRGTVMGLYGIGLPLGSALAGLVIAPLVVAYSWRAAFMFGTVLSLVMVAVVYVWLPESISYLSEKRPVSALETFNRIADRLGYDRVDDLQPLRSAARANVTFKRLFSGVLFTRTLLLWVGYAGLVSAFYFANTWTTKLIADTSGDASLGLKAGVMVQVGGVLGSLLFAFLSVWMRPRSVTTLILLVGALAFVIYANQIHTISVALVLTLFIGLATNGGVAAFYGVSPSVYPTVLRATGVGLMIGFGRGVAILAPLVAGYLISGGWSPDRIYLIFGGVLALASGAVVMLDITYRGRSEDPESLEVGAQLARV